MTQLVQKVSADGIHLPKELIEQCGVTEGHEVVIELEDSTIRITPAQVDAAEIADRAATYVFDYVGDAAAVEQPIREGGRWRVPVVLSYRPKELGTLIYSLRGELLRNESDAPRAMRERSRED